MRNGISEANTHYVVPLPVVGVGVGADVPLDDDPLSDPRGAGAPPTGSVAGAGAGAPEDRAGSESGGTAGRAVQNQPMICMPGQVKVPELAS